MKHGRLNIRCPNGTSPSSLCCKFECTDHDNNIDCSMYVKGSSVWYQGKVSDSQNATQSFKIYFFFVDSKVKSSAEISVNIQSSALSSSIDVVMRSYLMKERHFPRLKYFTNFTIYKNTLHRLWGRFSEKVTKELEPYFVGCIQKFYKDRITFLVGD
ncbi:uncharacterized protein LOC142584275 [Dermacentor variabilis]|uniref:uncharacterized protein LOC142584275 n=1 Tax=Dermacentor variabilis TaxID=34621 RepID=UPI003F5C0800